MEFGAEYTFSSAEQFWQELEDVISIPPMSTLAELDHALRNYIALVSHYKDEFLTDRELDHALFALLDSPLFTSHADRMMSNIIAAISPAATSSTLFVALMLILHLGMSNPLSASIDILHSDPKQGANGNAKIFRLMRKRWNDVVPVLIKWVKDAGVVHESQPLGSVVAGNGYGPESHLMPADGWDERVGVSATLVLYEVCRVQKLSPHELSIFTYEFISHLFTLVERTRDKTDETFNYTLIKLIIALNEQFMVSAVPPPTDGSALLPPPILPDIVGERKKIRGSNLVLELLKSPEVESKTFGENIIFILNRSNGSPDSLSVSLLILKILYLLFTTSGTQEFFYTNDLCVLVDVFIRELCDLGPESEGLKHTYLRVLHPLLTNTQLRHHPYKRPQLRRVLRQLISESHYRACDPTTRRLVERNLRGSWCEGIGDDEGLEADRRKATRKGSSSSATSVSTGGGEAVAVPSAVGKMKEARGSSWSIDAVAQEEQGGIAQHHRVRRRPSRDEIGSGSPAISSSGSDFYSAGVGIDRPHSAASSAGPGTPMSSSAFLAPLIEGTVTNPVAASHGAGNSPPGTPSSLASSVELPQVPTSTGPASQRRRRAPPPPPGLAAPTPVSALPSDSGPSSRPRTPQLLPQHQTAPHPPRSPAPGQRRAAPEPPSCRRTNPHARDLESEMEDNIRRLRVD